MKKIFGPHPQRGAPSRVLRAHEAIAEDCGILKGHFRQYLLATVGLAMQYWRYELERFYQACMALHAHTGDGSKGAMIHIALFIRKKKYDGTRSYVRVPHIEDFGGRQGDVRGALRRFAAFLQGAPLSSLA